MSQAAHAYRLFRARLSNELPVAGAQVRGQRSTSQPNLYAVACPGMVSASAARVRARRAHGGTSAASGPVCPAAACLPGGWSWQPAGPRRPVATTIRSQAARCHNHPAAGQLASGCRPARIRLPASSHPAAGQLASTLAGLPELTRLAGPGRQTLTAGALGLAHSATEPFPASPGRSTWLSAVGERTEGPLFLAGGGLRLDRHGAARTVRRVTRRAGIAKYVSIVEQRRAASSSVEQRYQAGDGGPVRQPGGPPLTTSLKAEKIYRATYSPNDAPGNQLPHEPGPGGRSPSPR
jgi:hypothetical protein